MPTFEALKIAEERGLDLVEVAPSAAPPVCRLMDYGRFRYEATRKEREARKVRKGKPSNELREVRFKTRIGEHDRSAKTRLVKRLLGEGSKVKVSVMFRGREIAHPDRGMVLLRLVAEDLVDDALLEKAPGFEGRWLSMILAPTAKRDEKSEVVETDPADTEVADTEVAEIAPTEMELADTEVAEIEPAEMEPEGAKT